MKQLGAAAIVVAASISAVFAAGTLETAVKVFPDQTLIDQGAYSLVDLFQQGEQLFRARFTIEDGAGRPFSTGDSKPTPRITMGPSFNRVSGPDASSCEGCHNQPIVGGSGDFAANVFVGAQFSDPPADNIASKTTNERNSTTLFGSGAVELLAAQMTADLQSLRDEAILHARLSGTEVSVELVTSHGVSFGKLVAHPNGYIDEKDLRGVDYDLVVRPFGVKGIAVSVREFSISALNHHHGIQAIERFGWDRTGVADFDKDGHQVEFTIGQLTALSVFQSLLPLPNRSEVPDQQGETLFAMAGCAECHTPKSYLRTNVLGEPNWYNRPGTLRAQAGVPVLKIPLDLPSDEGGYFIRVYSDLKRHNMCDEAMRFLCNEELKQDNVALNLFMTARLWNLSTSAPYCHRGNCTTIREAILVHGGDARPSKEKFLRLTDVEQNRLISYLITLGSEQASPSPIPALASR